MSLPGSNYMTHHQALQGITDMSQASPRITKKSAHLYFLTALARSKKLKAAFNFISVRSARNGPVYEYAGTSYRNLFLFLNFIPALSNIFL
jgi:hypothetical protein